MLMCVLFCVDAWRENRKMLCEMCVVISAVTFYVPIYVNIMFFVAI